MTWWKLFVASRHFKVLVGDRWIEWKNIEWIEGGIDVYRMMSTSGGWPPTPVYVHSKLGIIDDSYIIGSSNIAKQSFVTDSEADIVVQGSEEVGRLITLLWPVLVGMPEEFPANGSAWLQAFRRVAALNSANAVAAVAPPDRVRLRFKMTSLQRVNRGQSASGMPINSAMTIIGSGTA